MLDIYIDTHTLHIESATAPCVHAQYSTTQSITEEGGVRSEMPQPAAPSAAAEKTTSGRGHFH